MAPEFAVTSLPRGHRGIIGPYTRTKIEYLQKEGKIPITGVVSAQTIEEARKKLPCPSCQNQKPH